NAWLGYVQVEGQGVARSTMTTGEELIFLAWNDLVGITRGRGVPLKAYAGRKKTGINWAMAGHALTPFEDIADNPWGPMEEAHMTPAPESQVRVEPGAGGHACTM